MGNAPIISGQERQFLARLNYITENMVGDAPASFHLLPRPAPLLSIDPSSNA